MVEELLWSHQNEAIKMLLQYMDDFHNGITNQAALVQMPTGSGKSGIIAYLSRCLPDIGLTIVLTPRLSLRDQLSSDIAGRFFKHECSTSKLHDVCGQATKNFGYLAMINDNPP
ncbi:MAG: DEAD/DEAH box helicase family protein [Clostridiaceae bacterium]|nr:DEAD/DEAH box helicase family protein [Clostridiaceae bacterium]